MKRYYLFTLILLFFLIFAFVVVNGDLFQSIPEKRVATTNLLRFVFQNNQEKINIQVINEHGSYEIFINPLFPREFIYNTHDYLLNNNINNIEIHLTNVIQEEKIMVMFEEINKHANHSSYDYEINGNTFVAFIQVNEDFFSYHYSPRVMAGEMEMLFYKSLASAEADKKHNLKNKEKVEFTNSLARERFEKIFLDHGQQLFLVSEI